MAYNYLYQWSGNNFNKQKDLYGQLGSPYGSYRGTREQNMWLLNQVNSGKVGGQTATPQAAASNPGPVSPDLVQQYADQAGANKVYQGPTFEQVMPFYQTWDQFKPYAQGAAESQINPFINRQMDTDLSNYYNQAANTGAGRFGFGGAGQIQAQAESNRKSQTLDYLNQYQNAFKQLYYDPSQQAFNRAIELGQTPTTPKPPTWDEMSNLYKTMG